MGPLSSAAAQVALLWFPTTAAALRQIAPKWRPAVETGPVKRKHTYLVAVFSLDALSGLIGLT